MIDYGSIVIDDERDALLTEFGRTTIRKQYAVNGETSQQVFARAAQAFSGGDAALAQRLYDYASRLWFSFATPLASNGGTTRGLPISCFLNYVDDSVRGLAENFVENAFLSTNGGGIGTYWGHVRSIGERTSKGVDTPGVMPFMHVQDSQTMAYHQGSTRRGAAATYMDVSHPEIREFIKMRQTTGGDVHRKNENLHHGVVIPDAFMEAVARNGDWDLVDPHSKNVKQTVKARDIWIEILQQRARIGEPYLFFVDTANRAMPKTQQDLGLRIHHSNLCTEITLPTGPDRTAVCCLSSINLAAIDQWWPEREQFILDLITMLDNVLDVFIAQAPSEMWRAVNSAHRERALGLGTLGWSTLLQQRLIPASSSAAEELTHEIYRELDHLTKSASRLLGRERGEAPDMEGTGYRNAQLMAIAPNATSSIVCGGVSPSTENLAANAFTQKTLSGSSLVRNPALVPVLERHGRNDEETWSSIVVNKGSVQHLDFLSGLEREVFLTAEETDPMVTINLAAIRQLYLSQAQSVNLFFPPTVSSKVLHQVHLAAWVKGLKSLYYVRKSSVGSTGTGAVVAASVSVHPAANDTIKTALGDGRFDVPQPAVGYESDCVACEA